MDTHLDQPEARRADVYTGKNNIFYLELAIDRTEFIKLHDFEVKEVNPDEDRRGQRRTSWRLAGNACCRHFDHQELMKSLGM